MNYDLVEFELERSDYFSCGNRWRVLLFRRREGESKVKRTVLYAREREKEKKRSIFFFISNPIDRFGVENFLKMTLRIAFLHAVV